MTTTSSRPLQPGDPAPSFVLPAVNREGTVALENYRGKSPVLVLHSYQLAQPPGWPEQVRPALRRNPLLQPFARSQKKLLAYLLANFPTGTIGSWLDQHVQENGAVEHG